MLPNPESLSIWQKEKLAESLIGRIFVSPHVYRGRCVRKQVTRWRRIDKTWDRRPAVQLRMSTLRPDGTCGQGEYWDIRYLLNTSRYQMESADAN